MRQVLIVDDEPLVRVTLRSMVHWERLGFACVAEAANGEEALAALEAHPGISLVILDLVMPRMDGLELLRRMRERGPMPQVIMLTAHGDFPMVREAFKLGAADYLLKTEMEHESFEPLLAAAAERIDRFKDSPGSAGHAGAMRQEALRRLLESDQPQLLREELGERGIRLGTVLRLGLLTVKDFDAVSARYDPSSRLSFPLALMAAVEQVLDRHGDAQVLRIEDDAYVVFLSFPRHAPSRIDELSRELADDVRRALHSYVNVDADIAWSAATELDAGPSPSSLYRALMAGRTRPSRVVERARQRIREFFADPSLHLSRLSAELGVTPNHLSAQFTREMGRSFREYLTLVRVEAAKRLLAGSSLKVWEVAERVGYLNIEHFSRVFKKLTGVPPHLFTRAPSVDSINKP
jgi:two-component system response regulator YesN